jgi:hypothetical protein
VSDKYSLKEWVSKETDSSAGINRNIFPGGDKEITSPDSTFSKHPRTELISSGIWRKRQNMHLENGLGMDGG